MSVRRKNPSKALFDSRERTRFLEKTKKVMNPRAKLIKKLDTLTSLIVRLKEPACVTCGSKENLGNSHVFSRKSYSTRWDIRPDGNCHTGCWGCNYRHVTDQYPYFDWYIRKFGKERFDLLRKEHKQSVVFKDFQLEILIKKYDEIWCDLVNKEKLPF